jgi:hypothetical protein
MMEIQMKLIGLPENVINAIMIAQNKKQHSDFWYKLSGLNDRI